MSGLLAGIGGSGSLMSQMRKCQWRLWRGGGALRSSKYGEEHTGDAGGVLHGHTGHLGGVDDTALEEVASSSAAAIALVLLGAGVVAVVGLAYHYLGEPYINRYILRCL